MTQERNFERKIKYSCRKVLADSRPRVRGRFAKARPRWGACVPRARHRRATADPCILHPSPRRRRLRCHSKQNEEGAASTPVDKLDVDDFDFMDDGLIDDQDEHSGDAPPASFEHASGASTSGRSAGEEGGSSRKNAHLASVFQ